MESQWQLWQPQAASDVLDATWRLQPATVRFVGFGPEFDETSYEQNGHIRIDFGLDTPWVQDESELDDDGKRFLQLNVEILLGFILSVEKDCCVSSRLLWKESGELLAEKLLSRLQRLH